MLIALNLAVFLACAGALFRLGLGDWSLGRRVLVALVIGALFGAGLQLAYGIGSPLIDGSLEWINVVGRGYVNLLKVIVTPLVLVSMVAAIVKLDEIATLGKVGGLVIGVLLATTAMAALVGVFMAGSFGLSAEGLIEGERELASAADIANRQVRLGDLSAADMIVSFVPSNIFQDLAGLRDTSIIAVVIFGIILGVAGLLVTRDNPEHGAAFRGFVEVAQTIVHKFARMIIGLTPYGVLALMAKMAATSSGADILSLLGFVVASYVAIAIMFGVHALLLTLNGINAVTFFKRIWPVLAFSFTSRSSAAAIPLSIETQTEALGNDPAVANVAASFGATIGQNGCAGIYPAMLAVMVAPTVGIDPFAVSFLGTLVAVIVISSFGVAGVGGGATFAALMVLPAMGLPVELVALLISIEPLIDMGRTALNVDGSITAGTLTSKWLGVYAPPEHAPPITAS
ncbi:MAG: cation:dicarboxylase symporter family transporter [Halieaceae bacterium]|nr:cation:dicarboxylase symporter family transporter [Halieaceae bacterium]